jgi:hypothetical protein
MPEVTKKPTAASADVAEKLSAGYRYVKIPLYDVFKKPWGGFSVNKTFFAPGTTHLLEPVLATEVERILDVWQDGLVRTLRPDTDQRAIAAAERTIAVAVGPNVESA